MIWLVCFSFQVIEAILEDPLYVDLYPFQPFQQPHYSKYSNFVVNDGFSVDLNEKYLTLDS